jgi:hypothetical protein
VQATQSRKPHCTEATGHIRPCMLLTPLHAVSCCHSIPLNSSGAASSRSCTPSKNTCTHTDTTMKSPVSENATGRQGPWHASPVEGQRCLQWSKTIHTGRVHAAEHSAHPSCRPCEQVASQALCSHCSMAYLAEGHHGVGDEGDAQPKCSHQRVAAHELSSLQHSSEREQRSVSLTECLDQHTAPVAHPAMQLEQRPTYACVDNA